MAGIVHILTPRRALISGALACGLAAGVPALPAGAANQEGGNAEEPHLPPASPRVGPVHRGANGQIERIVPSEPEGKRLCSKNALCVGLGQAYPTLAAALAAAQAGDLIEVVGGLYRETAKITVPRVTVRGIVGQPHFDCTGMALSEDKACLLLAADGIVLENLEISGADLPESLGANGACIRNDGQASFTLRQIVCHSSQNGVLSSGGVISVENSEFFDNGWTDRTHNVYFGGSCRVTVHGSTFRDARIGHEFKSRCLKTTIADSTLRSSKGSRNIDISDGGETLVYRTTLIKTMGAENHEIIAFAPESCAHPGNMVLKDVRIVNSQPDADIRNYDKCAGDAIILEGVSVEGPALRQLGYIKTLGGAPLPSPVPAGAAPTTDARPAGAAPAGEARASGATLHALTHLAQGMAPASWREIPASSIRSVLSTPSEVPDDGGAEGARAVITAWNGSAYDEIGHKWYFFGGGHHAYSGNEVYRFDLEKLEWARLTKPSRLQPETAAKPCPDTVDGTPLPVHTYGAFVFSPPTGTIFLWGQFPYCRSGARYDAGGWEFNPATLRWSRLPDGPAADFADFDPNSGLLALMGNGYSAWLDPRQKVYSGAVFSGRSIALGSGVVIPGLKEFWGIDYDRDLFRFQLTTPVPGAAQIAVPRARVPPAIDSGSGMAWSPVLKRLVFWSGARAVETFDPATSSWLTLTNDTGPAPRFNKNGAAGRVYSKWKYVSELDLFIGYNDVDEGVWVYRPPRP